MERFTTLLDKPMDRRDFIKHIGIGIALVFGGGVVDRLIFADSRRPKQTAGYGVSTYGGVHMNYLTKPSLNR
ncbi:MAG TPA: twin-arginine translocation signal domain-containing protein [Patescibacteria group bacterium]|jgi:hypothetical protein|nr:twin-arginine translocation signal domain-containing protein [Patescibacteria group bacterium]